MHYRKATAKDIKQLVQMRWNHIKEYGKDAMQDKNEFEKVCAAFYEEAIQSGAWVIWVAESENQLIAHVCIQIIKKIPKPRDLYGRWGYITNVYTKPEFRNQGVGGTLMDHVQNWGKEQALELLILWPSEKSVEFYKRKGFAVNQNIMQYTMQEDE